MSSCMIWGGELNYKQAVKWYGKAAEQGNEKAQDVLQRLGY